MNTTYESWKNYKRQMCIVSSLHKPEEACADCLTIDDAFCIGHEGGLATINGLRLGRLPNVPVEWPEINAAWGHTMLLVHTIARKWEVAFETSVFLVYSFRSIKLKDPHSYRLIPMASYSRIERIADKYTMELYGRCSVSTRCWTHCLAQIWFR